MASMEETDLGAGWITEIALTNFMCHSYAKIDFIKQVNFITGQNGSGKSAILTALCVAFGTKAKGTQRGSSLKDFIKTGENFAVVEVTLCNEGSDAYKPDVYGNLITLERKLALSGSSQFTLKNYQGVKVTNKREEMEDLASHFNIEVENPCIVMTQDKSREFLHSGSDKDKYKFYIKATLLERVICTMDETWHMLQVGLDHIKEIKSHRRELEQETKELDEKLSSFEEIQRTQEKISKWKEVLAWLFVHEFDEQIDNCKQEADKFRVAIEECQSKIREAEAYREKALSDAQRSTELSEAVNNQIENLKIAQRAAKEKTKQAAQERGRLVGEVTAKEGRVKNCEARISQLQQLTSQAREKAAHDTRAEESERHAKILEKVDHIEKVSHEILRQREKSAEVESQLELLKMQQLEFQNQVNFLKSKENEYNGWLRRLEDQMGNRMTAFGGHKVLQLLELIERNERRFETPPIGPLGAHLTLLEDSYGLAVEVAIGGTLDSFVVSSQRDSKLLQQLGKHAGIQVTSIIYKFDLPPIQPSPAKVPDSNLTTVEKVLNISNDIIRNVLIDLGNIERTVLVRDYEEGKDIAFQPGSRVSQCIARDGLKMFLKGGMEVCNKKPNHTRNSRLRKDIAQDKMTAQLELNSCLEKRRELELQLNSCSSQMQQLSREFQEYKKQEIQQDKGLQKLKRDLAYLQRQAEIEAAEKAPVDVQVYLDEIEGLKDELTELNVALQKLKTELSEANSHLETCRQADQEVQEELKKQYEEADVLDEKRSRIQERIAETDKELTTYEKFCGEQQARLDSAIAQQTKLENDQANNRAKAMEYCLEPSAEEFQNLPRSRTELGKKITAKQKEIEEFKRRRGLDSVESLTRKRDKNMKILTKRQGQIQLLDRRFDMLKHALRTRKATLNAAMLFLKNQLNWNFRQHLMKKGASGKIEIHDDEKLLTMEIEMPNDNSHTKVRDTKSLSGGERSFSTLCYALSLHEMVAAPFRAMDEFDIFMDNVTRKICLDEAVKYALENGSQWIFITPHDISSVPAGEHVKKQQMPSPRN